MAILVFIGLAINVLLFSVTPCLCGWILLDRRIKVIKHQVNNHPCGGNV
jgi:hypothetical protein